MDKQNEEKLGTVKISEDIILACAVSAALKTQGVYGLSQSFTEVITDTITKNILGKDPTHRGVRLSQAEDGYSLDVFIIVDYAVRIPEVAFDVQKNIKKEIENMTGERVKAVNIHVQEVHFPDEEEKTNDKN